MVSSQSVTISTSPLKQSIQTSRLRTSSEDTTTGRSKREKKNGTIALEVLLDVHQRVEDDVCEGSIVEMREIGGGIGERLVRELVHELENDR